MKEPEVTKGWVTAGKLLAVNAAAKVPCPACGQENLAVRDVVIDGTRKFERIMTCPNCQSCNVLFMNKLD
jgi:predicted RNA-binding Zn-ribbon protein involved in translation (DUF1610 family)